MSPLCSILLVHLHSDGAIFIPGLVNMASLPPVVPPVNVVVHMLAPDILISLCYLGLLGSGYFPNQITQPYTHLHTLSTSKTYQGIHIYNYPGPHTYNQHPLIHTPNCTV